MASTIKEKLNHLLHPTSKPCTTIIIPTHKTSPGRENDPAAVERAIIEAERIIQKYYGEQVALQMSKLIMRLKNIIDFLHETEGLGLYVSPDLRAYSLSVFR